MSVDIPNYLNFMLDLKLEGKTANLIREHFAQKIKEQHLTKSLHKPYYYVMRFGPRIKDFIEIAEYFGVRNITDELSSRSNMWRWVIGKKRLPTYNFIV